MKEPKAYFEASLQNAEAELNATEAKLIMIAIGRFLLFAIAVAMIVYAIWTKEFYTLFGLFPTAIVFVFLARASAKFNRIKALKGTVKRINQVELDLLDFKLEGLDDGREYTDPNHPYASDLDLFGPKSLFQWISRSETRAGKDRLAERLKMPLKEEIQDRQQAIDELKAQPDWRQWFQALGGQYEDPGIGIAAFKEWLNAEPKLSHQPIYRIMAYGMPVILISICIASWLFGLLPGWIPLLMMALNYGILMRMKSTLEGIYSMTDKRSGLVKAWAEMLEWIEEAQFESEMLVRLQDKGQSASSRVKEVTKIMEMLEYRLSGATYLMINLFTFWDVHYCMLLEKWKQKNKELAPEWLSRIAEMECLASFAALSFAHPEYIIPELQPGESRVLKGEGLGHPMISESIRVSNPVDLEGNGLVWLITGSNMSGKSTYLRTIGINLILAMNGASVCANSLKFSPFSLITSMRAIDSLSESVSSFYAELRRLKMVLEFTRENPDVLFLLDEILKGTNSNDRHKGAEALIRQLILEGGTGMVSTHDLELTAMEHDLSGQLLNYSFNSIVSAQDEIGFTYELTEGPCKSFNASALMRNMGIEVK